MNACAILQDGLAGEFAVEKARSRRQDLIEAVVGLALILLVIWAPRQYQRMLYWAPVAWIVGATWLSFRGWRAMGWRTTNLVRSLWVVGVALAIAAVSVMVSARLGVLHAPANPVLLIKNYWGYTIWSFEQQFLLLDFFLARLMRVLGKPLHAAWVATGIFAFAHLPNPVLVPMTALWGFAACLIFLKYRNLWPLGMAHAIFGVCVAVSLPATLTHNMRVGSGYWRFHPRPEAVRSVQRRKSDQSVSTEAWVMDDAATRRFERQALP